MFSTINARQRLILCTPPLYGTPERLASVCDPARAKTCAGAGCMMTMGRRLTPSLMAAMLSLLLGSAEAHLVTVRCAHHPRKQTPLPPRPTRVPRPLNHTPRSRTLPPPPQRCHSRRLALAAWSQVCTATAKSTCAERAVWFLFGTYHSSGSTVQGRIAITPPEETEYTTAFGDSCDAGGRAYATYIGDDPASASDYDCEIPGTGGGDEGTKSCRYARDIMNKCGPSSGQANGAVGANKLPADADITCYAYNHSTGRTVAVDPMTDAPFPLTQEVYNNRRSGLSVKSGSWYHHIRSYHLAKVTSFGSGTYKVRTLNTGVTMDPCDGADHITILPPASVRQNKTIPFMAIRTTASVTQITRAQRTLQLRRFHGSSLRLTIHGAVV